MNLDLLERYLYAVSRYLPAKHRADIEQELRTLIDDMLEEKCGGAPPTEQDLRQVLAQLGTPAELAERYRPEGQKSLIGPPYYTPYKIVLAIALPAAGLGILLSCFIEALLGERAEWYQEFPSWLKNTAAGLAFAFSIVTLLFAGFQRWGIHVQMLEDLDNLPPVPSRKDRIPMWECVVGIAGSFLLCAFFLIAPNFLFLFWQGEMVPLFSSERIRSLWFLFAAVSVLGVLKHSMALYEGQHTARLALVTLAANILSIFCFFGIWLDGRIINPEFIDAVSKIFPDNPFISEFLFQWLHLWVLGAGLLGLVLETGQFLYRAFQRRGSSAIGIFISR